MCSGVKESKSPPYSEGLCPEVGQPNFRGMYCLIIDECRCRFDAMWAVDGPSYPGYTAQSEHT